MTRPKLYEFMFRGIDARDGIWLYDNWDTLTPAERADWGFTDASEPAEPVVPVGSKVVRLVWRTPRPRTF